VIFPANLRFNTGAPEIMTLNKGRCKVKLAHQDNWQEYNGGEEFSVPGDSYFDIEVLEILHYVCHFG
jgi:purine/pyrimidine-nucleoside phosphorylase